MSEPSTQRLATLVQPRLTEARIQRQWSSIVAREAQRTPERLWWYVGSLTLVTVALMAIGAVALRRQIHAIQPLAQLTVEHDASGVERVTFPEGLTVTLQREARYRVLERTGALVHLRLDEGSASFDVVPGRDRKVMVAAAGFEIEVVGTAFDVALLGNGPSPDLRIDVRHGTVRVRQDGRGSTNAVIRTLGAGESWATHTAPAPNAAAPDASAALANDHPATPETASSAEYAAALPPASAASVSPATAKGLFELAESYRIKGRPREAAAALDRLRRSYPSDSRAGLACFELGRLRMDLLGDPSGALNALSDAVRLDPSARFGEDAQARIVQLYGRLRQTQRCRKAQLEYLSRYPAGPHANVVKSECAP